MKLQVSHCPIVFATEKPGYHFCGYYDISPVDRTGRYLLTHRVHEFHRMPKPEDVVELGVWDLHDGSYRKLADTRAYNWQQGSKLQWLGPDYATRVVFNDRRHDTLVTRILDIESGEVQTQPHPVYTMHPNGQSAVCVNMERTYFPRPGYSYQGVVKPEWNVPLHPEDGLFRLDMVTGEYKRIVSTSHLVGHKPLGSMKNAEHYLEHAQFNVDGSRFIFLHRWKIADAGIYARAYTADEHGGDLRLLLDSGRFSHSGWRSASELTAFAAMPTALNAMRKSRALVKYVLGPLLPIYRRIIPPHSALRRAANAGTYLRLLDDDDQGRVQPLAPGVDWWSDGHCTWHPTNERWMLTDTYEDADFKRHLYLYDARDNRVIEIGRFHSTPSTCSTGWRCDLHPRFDRSGRRVIIDSLHEGDQRQVYVIDVSSIIDGDTA